MLFTSSFVAMLVAVCPIFVSGAPLSRRAAVAASDIAVLSMLSLTLKKKRRLELISMP